MTEAPEDRSGYRLWQPFRSNPEYSADWRAHGSAAVQLEPVPFPLRIQSEADLLAARWGLLVWEYSQVRNRSSPYWADVPMLRARAVEAGEGDAPARAHAHAQWAGRPHGLRRGGCVGMWLERGSAGAWTGAETPTTVAMRASAVGRVSYGSMAVQALARMRLRAHLALSNGLEFTFSCLLGVYFAQFGVSVMVALSSNLLSCNVYSRGRGRPCQW